MAEQDPMNDVMQLLEASIHLFYFILLALP